MATNDNGDPRSNSTSKAQSMTWERRNRKKVRNMLQVLMIRRRGIPANNLKNIAMSHTIDYHTMDTLQSRKKRWDKYYTLRVTNDIILKKARKVPLRPFAP
jgi:hypothetical protein